MSPAREGQLTWSDDPSLQSWAKHVQVPALDLAGWETQIIGISCLSPRESHIHS